MTANKSDSENLVQTQDAAAGFSIFILRSKPETLKAAEVFLRNRNWRVGTGTNFRETLAYIIQKQPEFILIAADHPNKKIKILPKLLAQAFPVRLIAYAESQSTASINSLQDFGLEYSLFPPVSGPAIERIILKIKRDEEKSAQDIKNKIAAGELDTSAEETIRLKGLNSSGMNTRESFENARAALNQLIAGDDASATAGSLTTEPGQNKNDVQFAYLNSEKSQDKPGSLLQEGKSDWNPLQQSEKGHESQSHNYNSEQNSHSVQNHDYGQAPSRDDRLPIMEFENPIQKKKLTPQYKNENSQNSRGLDSLIVKGAQNALDESVRVRDDLDQYQVIEKTSNCACLIIESERFSGYLVAALGKDRKFDESFMDQIKKRLFSFLKSHGEPVRDENSMNLKLEEVAFEDWAIEQADFLRKSIHDGNEIAMAFFPTKDTSVKLEESVSEKMLMVNIDELKDDTIVEFDLYIYMPENNKYILYTPQGRTLYGKQRGRLVEKGVSHMHLRKESAHNVKKYRAQNYLNEKIQSFKNAQKIKSS